MVEQIEELSTILEGKFFVHLGILQEAEIKLLETTRAQNVATSVSVSSRRRDSKCVQVGHLKGGQVGRNIQRLARNYIGPLVVGRKLVAVAGDILSQERRKRRAGLGTENCLDGPSFQKFYY